MFKCQVTNKITEPGEKLNRIVIKTREKVYSQRVIEDGELITIEVGRGWEIVKEINASEEGLSIYNKMVENGLKEEFIRKFLKKN
jgi:hypothetical protein